MFSSEKNQVNPRKDLRMNLGTAISNGWKWIKKIRSTQDDFALLIVFLTLLIIFFVFLPFKAFLAIVLGLIIMSIRVVRTVEFAAVTHFWRRTGRILTEGVNFVWPIVSIIERFNEQLDSDEVAVTFTTKDRVAATTDGSLQWRPDREIVIAERTVKTMFGGKRIVKNWLRFIENDEDVIIQGIRDAVKSTLGAVAGRQTADDFIQGRDALGLLINAILRLKDVPHDNPSAVVAMMEQDRLEKGGAGDEIKLGTLTIPVSSIRKKGDRDVVETKDVPCILHGEVRPEHVLTFYGTYGKYIRQLLEEEHSKPDKSTIEERYGIHIETYALAGVKFTDATQRAFERERQARAEAEGSKARFAEYERERNAIAAANPGMDPAVVSNLAAANVGILSKQVVGYEGINGPTLPLGPILMAPQTPPPATPPPSTPERKKPNA